MWINNAHLWSRFVRSASPCSSCSFICFPRADVVILKEDVSLVAAGVMCRYSNEWMVDCLQMGISNSAGSEAPPLWSLGWVCVGAGAARFTRTFAFSRQRNSRRISERLFSSRNAARFHFFCASFCGVKCRHNGRFCQISVPIFGDRHEETRNKPCKVAEGLNRFGTVSEFAALTVV